MPVNDWKTSPATQSYEAKVKDLLNGKLKQVGVTCAQLAAKLGEIGVQVTEHDKITQGAFTSGLLVQCLGIHQEDA